MVISVVLLVCSLRDHKQCKANFDEITVFNDFLLTEFCYTMHHRARLTILVNSCKGKLNKWKK